MVTKRMATNDRWDELAASGSDSPGTNRLRVAPSSEHELFIGLVQPGARHCFWYEVPTDTVPADYRLPSLRSIRTSIQVITDAPATTRIQLELEKAELGDVYKAMVNDLIGTIAATPDDDSGLSALSQRTERWRRLLETNGTGGLSTSDRRGLTGELIILGRLLDTGGSAVRTVTSWTGPYSKHQDFQADKAAIEVKTTVTKQPQSLIIASERELDSTGVPHLYLVHVSLDERQGGSGQSLNALVAELRRRLANNTVALSAFEDALLSYGYLNKQASLYDAPFYSVRQQNAFEVVDGFPCITEADVRMGIGDVRYRIQLAALHPFAVPLSRALTTTVAP
jgi:Putative  PD-(D/E)XK family member, (DUF4420)